MRVKLMNKILILGALLVLLIGSVGIVSFIDNYNDPKDIKYQGPVPIGYDIEHFRYTGETIKMVIIDES